MRILESFLLASIFCLSENPASEVPQAEKAMEVSYCQLAKMPESFVGKRIKVRAIYRYAFEINQLETAECCLEEIEIWVEISPHLQTPSAKLFRKLPKGTGLALVVFVGRFDEGTYGTFGDRFQLAVDQIEKVERTSRSSRRQDDPGWVPRNCKDKHGSTPRPRENSRRD
jgi:hypothetical protein